MVAAPFSRASICDILYSIALPTMHILLFLSLALFFARFFDNCTTTAPPSSRNRRATFMLHCEEVRLVTE